jgi:subtilase family serine protease
MFKTLTPVFIPAAALALQFALPATLFPQSVRGGRSRALVTAKIDNTRLHRLAGNTRPQANAQNDVGPAPGDLAMEHMMLQLQRPAEQEQALDQLIDQLHDPSSPNYHKWMTAEQFGAAFGPAQSDIAAITSWLEAEGFTVNAVYPSGMLIDFSGTAGAVRNAFHTEIHYLNVNGEQHIANMSDPRIPAALAGAVSGVISMHDFRPHAMSRPHPKFSFTSGGSKYQAIVPADLATIYNFSPAFAAGYTGQGQTIAVIEDSDLYSPEDWNTFRSTFGLSQYASGSLTTIHPSGASGTANCMDPRVLSGGDDGEATLDAEWASAAAPGAAIQVASCANTRTTFGGFIALVNLINAAQPPSIISLSYGECEVDNGASANAAFRAAYQQAVAEGISVFVSAGDEGAASCDAGSPAATHGIGVSGFASTPYNVAAGGTDFGDTLAGSVSAYWNSTNSATYGSARSYIPEIPWNDSCASGLLAGFLGFSTGYGASGLCSSSTAQQYGLVQVAAGSGGPSGCATGAPSINGVVGGTCAGYPKPSWQAGVAGIPNDGVRDIPDVSLFAGTGVWGHYYVTCWSNQRAGGASCTGDPSTWAGAGGTSFAAPILAGIQALINQKTGKAQGNPNYVYYKLAAQEYGSTGSAVCNSANGSSASGSCIFYNVTQGDIAVDCSGTDDCFGATVLSSTGGHRASFAGGFGSNGNRNGALSTTTDSYSPAYGTSAGWNFATGIGSVNVLNLLNNWSTVAQ